MSAEPQDIRESVPQSPVRQEKIAFDKRKRLPVGVIAVQVHSVPPNAANDKLLNGLARFGGLAVVDRKKRLVGFIREQDVLIVSEPGEGAPVFDFDRQEGNPLSLCVTDTVETAIETFGQTDQHLIPIVDKRGRYTGECASRSQLFRLLNGLLRPPRAGGLATPLGVYMTSGYHTSGAGWKGLVATGILFGVLIHVLQYLWFESYLLLVSAFPGIVNLGISNYLVMETGFTMLLVLGSLRLSPMAGLHAAEHMTINAIERDMELTEEVVRLQPREHLRCGTNLMVLLGGIQLVITSLVFSTEHISLPGLFLYGVFWIFLILKFWRPAGLWVQRHFTTRPPTPGQLESGLKAGRELLERFAEEPHGTPSIWRRIWGSGLIMMIVSFLATAGMIGYLLEKLGI